MPRFAILIHAPAGQEDVSPDDAHAYDRHAEDLIESGVMVAAFALEAPESATSIRVDRETPGPFLVAQEVLMGFCVVDADDLEAARKIARANPSIRQGGGVEVRAVEGDYLRCRDSL